MITTVELCHRIGRRARGSDFTKLDMSEQIDVLQAASTALVRLYNALPNYFREQTQGFVLKAPLTVAGIGATQFSKTVTGLNATEDQIGCSIAIEGDSQWNQILGPNELQNPYMGESAAALGGTLYGDAIHSTTFPLDRIVGNPRFADQSQLSILPLGIPANSEEDVAWYYQQNCGRPVTWWPQTFGTSQGNSPAMVLRFAPAPDTNYAIKVKIAFWPKTLTLTNYQSNTALPVPDQFVETSLIKMAIEEFMASPAFVKSPDDKDVKERGLEGEAFAKNQPGRIGVPSNKVFTPIGF